MTVIATRNNIKTFTMRIAVVLIAIMFAFASDAIGQKKTTKSTTSKSNKKTTEKAAEKKPEKARVQSEEEEKVRSIITFLQYVLNTLGSPSTPSRD